MAPFASISTASISSLLLPSARPTSEPSKYCVQFPLVTSPTETGVNSRISSSAAVNPGTDALPVVEIRM